ncbi:hypothetical protein L0244_39325, partial [bacterium]|nr:hypothetical protein [bacterium]
NLFMVQPVGEFVVSDIVDEVTLFLTYFWRGELQPSAEEQAYLVSYCSRHPLVMQVVSYWVLRNREMGLNELAFVEEIEKELSSYFRDKQERIKKWLNTKGLKAFKNLVWTSEQIGKFIKNLSPFSIQINS